MASVNKAIILGNLGQDPEVRYTPSGGAVVTLPIATTSKWKDKQTGEQREKTEWHRVVLYNRLAEVAGQYLSKGKAVYIEGRIETRKWQDKDGFDRYTTEIIGDQMQMVGGRHDTNEGASTPNASLGVANRQDINEGVSTSVSPNNSLGVDSLDDDIPF